jgi:glutamate--cysteine ligase
MSLVPHLMTAFDGTMHSIELTLLNNITRIESWFEERFQETPASITSSVDLRYAGFKIAPVDTNVFPAGFNNLNRDFLPLCVKAAKIVLSASVSGCQNVLLLPENHTRNQFYLQSVSVLRDILMQAGFYVRIGSLDETRLGSINLDLDEGVSLSIERLIREENRLRLNDFNPCFILLNNDLSSGVPTILQDLQQSIMPILEMGWSSRFKSNHFQCYEAVVNEFASLIDIDPWLLLPLFTVIDGVDFMQQIGIEMVVDAVDTLLCDIRKKYVEHGILEKPFVVVKADNGTYGMGVMMVHEGAQLLSLNRKQRTNLSATKGRKGLTRFLVQEGIHSIETMSEAVAEPVVYMIGEFVVGGFYRVHSKRGVDENLNAPGMYFEPMNYADAATPNRFYAYAVIARLASLAAAREMRQIRGVR